MPLSELFHKLKTGERMSNGQKVKNRKQAIAIGYSMGYLKEGKKKKKKGTRTISNNLK
jgi:hypothetical protein